MRILHIIDHSIPLHSGYTFRTLSILRHQRALGWETFHQTRPKQSVCKDARETVEGWEFFRKPSPEIGARLPGLGELALMNATARRLFDRDHNFLNPLFLGEFG